MNTSESETFDKYQKAEERIEKMKLRLEKFMSQMDTIFSFYIDVLACRSPANNYALFFLERYLQLKIKFVRVGKLV